MSKQKIFIATACKAPDIVRRSLLSWLLGVTVEYLRLPPALRDLSRTEGLGQMSFFRMAAIVGSAWLFLFGLSRFRNTAGAERWGMVVVFGILAVTSLASSFTWAFLTACVLILAVLGVFAAYGWDSRPALDSKPKKAPGRWLWITAGISVLFFLLVSGWTVGRVRSFSAPTFDFGIFSQMFYYMKGSGAPMTTVERDGLLSHFAVHVSPIYYLLLPIYAVAPRPETLQILQAAVLTSAVIPLWLLGKHHGLSGAQRGLLCAVLLLYPAYSGGTGYDIHENCFLTPLLFWLFYGIDKKNTTLTATAAVLTLLVKEDAAVYVAVTGLYLVVKALLRNPKPDRKDCVTGILLLAAALGWFLLVTGYLTKKGDGVMTYRYGNFMYDGSGSLLTVVKAVVRNPMKAVYECLDGEKLPFLAMTLLPLLGLPLLTRRYERYLLLIPYVLVNLMPDYRYQHDIFFQYTFGSVAFLLYLTVVNLEDQRLPWLKSLALLTAAAVSGACFCTRVLPKAVSYPIQAVRYHSYYQNIRNTLSTVPEAASVTATTFYTTFLSQREILYDVRYSSWEHLLETEYVVLSVTAADDYRKYSPNGTEDGFAQLTALLEENGYEWYDRIENVLVIYRRK